MKLVEINWHPTPRQLRQFGLICLLALPAIAWLWGGSLNIIGGCGVVGLLLAVVGWVVPQLLKPVFVTMSVLAIPIGLVVGEIAMVLIYFVVFLPVGLYFKVIRRDFLQLRKAPKAGSYWQAKRQPKSVASYYRQS